LKSIRVVALGLFSRNGKILACRGVDTSKGEIFFRPFGGGVEFGESAEQALHREIAEELGKTITKVCLLGVVENLFTFEGQQGHEIVFVFDASFEDETVYADGVVNGVEGKTVMEGHWVPVEDVLAGKIRLYPERIVGLLGS